MGRLRPPLPQATLHSPRHVTHSPPALNEVPTRSPNPHTTTTMMALLAFAYSIQLFPLLALAQHNHGGSGTEGGTMTMYLHFTPGESVLFGPWILKTDRAIFGTCVGVFMLGMVDRWFSATATIMNAYWNKKYVGIWLAWLMADFTA